MVKVDERLILSQVFIIQFNRKLIKRTKFFLANLLVLLVFKAFIIRQRVIRIQKRVSYLINNILAHKIDRVVDFVLNKVEVVINCLLKQSAFRFNAVVELVFLNLNLYLILADKNCGTHVIMIFSHTKLTPSWLFPCTAL